MNVRFLRFSDLSKIVLIAVSIGLIAAVGLEEFGKTKAVAEERPDLLETALFSRDEFFGADARIPRPTAEAREVLVTLSAEFPDRADILIELARAEEGLGNYDAAETAFRRAAEIVPENRDPLLAFFGRRARFADEADLLHQLLRSSTPEKRLEFVGKLVDLAIKHDLRKYLLKDFLFETTIEYKSEFGVFENIINRLARGGRTSDSIDLIRGLRDAFPARADEVLDREIELLRIAGREHEIEQVYSAAFDPFWSEARSEAFYDHLSTHDRLREYGSELAEGFRRNPADMDTAIRLAHYRTYRYEASLPIILQLERAKKVWAPDELLTVTRFLIRQDEGELAARFLNTLYERGDLDNASGLRQRLLYQLFELFSDAEERRLPLTKGDLELYRDITRTDVNLVLRQGLFP